MAGGQLCGVCLALSDSGMALKPCARADCPQAARQAQWAAMFAPAPQRAADAVTAAFEELEKYNADRPRGDVDCQSAFVAGFNAGIRFQARG